MNPRGIQSDLKSIPASKAIKTLLTLTDHGTTGVVTNQGAAEFRIVDDNTIDYHEGLLAIQVKTTGGKGATPTAVGASQTFTIKYAFSDYDLDIAEVPTVLAPVAESLICALPNAISVRATGVLTIAGVPALNAQVLFDKPAANGVANRFLYNWIDSGLLDLNASPFNVATGVSAAAAALDLIDAINRAAYPSPAYSTGMILNPLVSAATGGAGIVNVTAKEYGTAGNQILTTETGANTSFGAGTLTGGSSAGTAIFATQPFVHRGRFMYIWYDRTAFASANALIDVEAKLIRL